MGQPCYVSLELLPTPASPLTNVKSSFMVFGSFLKKKSKVTVTNVTCGDRSNYGRLSWEYYHSDTAHSFCMETKLGSGHWYVPPIWVGFWAFLGPKFLEIASLSSKFSYTWVDLAENSQTVKKGCQHFTEHYLTLLPLSQCVDVQRVPTHNYKYHKYHNQHHLPQNENPISHCLSQPLNLQVVLKNCTSFVWLLLKSS